MIVEYKSQEVLTAARRRVARVFDEFGRIIVSVSGGKDSTVLFDLVMAEAQSRDRNVTAFFLDQEVEYASTIEIIREMMSAPRVQPLWVQVPIWLTNATSHREDMLYAWDPDAEWMRPKDSIATHAIEDDYAQRFYGFFEWLEQQDDEPTAYLVGLRSKESMNRFRAVTSNAGYRGWPWSTKTTNPVSWRCYPIYDWTFGDVWKYIADNELSYNRLYDRMFAAQGVNARTMRVSNLIHERSFRCLAYLQEYEPSTYDVLVRRLSGVHSAALYALEDYVFDAKTLPAAFDSWRAFRDHLLATTPSDRTERFRTRFERQNADEDVHRQQCRQLLLNDWENSIPVRTTDRQALRDRLWDLL